MFINLFLGIEALRRNLQGPDSADPMNTIQE